jgi:NAD(P)-dependent dehydrogenase (short-subunit alcohol dehydrogenase family)
MELQGAAAIVSGGASGLGEATARALAAAGATVTIADLNEERGKAVATEIGGVFAHTNVVDEESVAAAVQAATDTGSPLRVAVNCAGIAIGQRIVDREGNPHPLDAFRKVIDINLIGTFNLMRIAASAISKTEPLGADGERGVIVNTGSIAAVEGQVAIVGMTLPVARDLAAVGVRVCTILPGVMNTPLFETLPEESKASLAKDVLFPKRLGHPAEFGSLVRTICENPYFNAEVFRLDGGVRMPAK